MAKVLVIGRGRGGRCVYCHDSLDGDVRSCPECQASWHQECGAEATRCPTIGCSGPAPGGRAAPVAARAAGAPAAPPPSAEAREGPYRQLRRNAVVAGAGLAGALVVALAMLVAVVASPSAPQGLLLAIASPVLLACAVLAWKSVTFLGRLPAVWRYVGRLLDGTRPRLMKLTSFEQQGRWFVRLGSFAGDHVIALGIQAPPAELRRPREDPVLVYGDMPGPFLVQLPDGALLLLDDGD